MPFIPLPGSVKVTVKQVYLAQIVTNTFYVGAAVTVSPEWMAALAVKVIDSWNANVGPLQSNECQYGSVLIRDMNAETGLGSEYSFPALSGGDRLGGGMPGNVAIACKLITALGGRNFRGRLFLAALTEDQFVGNKLTDIAHAQVEDNMRTLVQDINLDGDSVLVASFYEGTALVENGRGETVWTPVPRAEGIGTPVTNVVVDPFADSQRKRLEGRGN